MSVAAADSTLPEILAIATAISGAGDLRSLLHLILGKARALTAADAGSIFLVERAAPARFGMVGAPAAEGGLAEDRLWFAVSQNASIEARRADGIEPQVLDIRFPLSPERLVGWCALSGEVLNIPDVYALDPALPIRQRGGPAARLPGRVDAHGADALHQRCGGGGAAADQPQAGC